MISKGLFIILCGISYAVSKPGIEIISNLEVAGRLIYLCNKDDILTASYVAVPTCNCLYDLIIGGTLSFGPNNFIDFNEFKNDDDKSVPAMDGFSPIQTAASINIYDLKCVDGNKGRLLRNSTIYTVNVIIGNVRAYNTSLMEFDQPIKPNTVEYKEKLAKSTGVKASGDVTVNGDLEYSSDTGSLNICGDLVENVYDRLILAIVNRYLMKREKCDIEEGTTSVLPKTFIIQIPVREPLKCGKYNTNINVKVGEDLLIVAIWATFTISPPLECIADE